MVVNLNKLKGKMVEKELTKEQLAINMGIDKATLYRKFKSGGEKFTIGEIHKISETIGLTSDEARDIFFS